MTPSGFVFVPLPFPFHTLLSFTFSDIFGVVRQAVQVEGPRVLWRGLLPTLLRDVPFSAMYWVGYEHFRRVLGYHYHGQLTRVLFLVYWCSLRKTPPLLSLTTGAKFRESEPPIGIAFASGALSGAFAATLTLPFDVIKTWQQSLLGRFVQSMAQEERLIENS